MYGDETVLLADNQLDMQKLLNLYSLYPFCEHNKLLVNNDKKLWYLHVQRLG